MNEWILIAIMIILMIAGNALRQYLPGKLELIISLVAFTGLMFVFVSHLVKQFSYLYLGIVTVFFVLTGIAILKKIKNLKQAK